MSEVLYLHQNFTDCDIYILKCQYAKYDCKFNSIFWSFSYLTTFFKLYKALKILIIKKSFPKSSVFEEDSEQ